MKILIKRMIWGALIVPFIIIGSNSRIVYANDCLMVETVEQEKAEAMIAQEGINILEKIEPNSLVTKDSYETFCLSGVAEGKSIKERVDLYGNNNQVVGSLYLLAPNGYVIVDSINNDIVEYSDSQNFAGYVNKNDKIYYAGPLNYYTYNGKYYTDIRSNEVLSSYDVEDRLQRYFSIINSKQIKDYEELSIRESNLHTSNALNDIPTTVEFKLIDGLRTFNYNPDGRCGSVAAAILLAYYNDNVDESFVEDKYLEDGTGEAFSQYLFSHIEGLQAGSYTYQVRNGLNWYLKQIGKNSNYTAVSQKNTSFSTYKNQVEISPVILDISNHEVYREHWVVGYGYKMTAWKNGGMIIKITNFAIVNNGWGQNDININYSYIYDIVYIE